MSVKMDRQMRREVGEVIRTANGAEATIVARFPTGTTDQDAGWTYVIRVRGGGVRIVRFDADGQPYTVVN